MFIITFFKNFEQVYFTLIETIKLGISEFGSKVTKNPDQKRRKKYRLKKHW